MTVEVRATVNLVGLSVGTVVRVDPDRPYIRMLLENELLVRTGRETPIPAVAAEPVVLDVATAPEETPAPKPAAARKRAPRKKPGTPR